MRLHAWRFPGLLLIPALSLAPLAAPLAAIAQTPSHRQPQQHAPNASGAIPMPPDRAADSYAIYSLLMPGQPFAQMPPDQTAHWAISSITVNTTDRNPAIPPQGQLKPPPDHVRQFREALLDFEANQYVRVQLTQDAFHIDHDFSLLSPDDIAALRTARTAGYVPSADRSRWDGYPGITFFSEVYFDEHHDAALVYMNDWCAHLCAAGTWIYLERNGGHWERRSGIVVPGA